MLILASGDFQTTVGNIDRCRAVVDQIVEVLDRHNDPKKFFIHLGDITEVMNPLDKRVANFIVESFLRIKDKCLDVFFIRGNHDNVSTQDDVPSVTPLIEALGIQVADKSWTDHVLGADVNLFMVPYFRDPIRQRKEFRQAYSNAVAAGRKALNILAFHNEIAGCERTAFTKGEGLTLTDIGSDAYRLCISGHIHRPHYFKDVMFVGSPFCCDWGEANEQKSLLLIKINEKASLLQTERIPSRVPGWYDPKVPDFKPPASWKDCRVRISIPVSLDPLKELEEARKRLEVKYPGAILNLVPEYEKPDSVSSSLDLKSNDDETLLRNYLSKIALPEDVTVDQVIAFLQKYLPSLTLFGVQGLKLKSVEATEVLCFKHLKLDLTRKGLTLITGKNSDWGDLVSNGAGKSSAVTSFVIGLFGKTLKDQTHDGWARQETLASAKLTLEAELPDQSSLQIVRGRRPSLLRVYRNGSEISMGDPNATQKMIEQLTNLTWDVLTNSVYIGQHEIGSVFGTEKERKELFSHLLGLDRFLIAREKINKIVLRSQKLICVVEDEITYTQASLTEAQSNFDAITETLKSTPEIDPKDIREKEWEVDRLEAIIRNNEKLNKDLDAELEENQKTFEGFLSKSTSAEAKARFLTDQLNTSIKVSGTCPVCGSTVSVKTLEKHTNELKKKIDEAGLVIEKYEALQNTNRSRRKIVIERVQSNRLENTKTQKMIDALKQSVTRLQEQTEARKRLSIIVSEKQDRVLSLKKRLDIHTRALKACQEEKRFLELCMNTVSRNGLPVYLCSLVAPQLNEASVRYSQAFSDGEISSQFQMSNGEIDVNICNLHGGKSIKDQSVGELSIAGLITAFAFRDALVPLGILVLDEPGEGLDSENASRFAKGLNAIKDLFGSLFVISHNPYILAGLEPDYHLEVVKKDGVSTVTEIAV